MLNSTDKPLLFYAARCGKCRILSQIVVWASLQQIERIPIEAEAATELYQLSPEAQGKLVLFHAGFQGGKIVIGSWVYPLVPWTVLKAWLILGGSKLKSIRFNQKITP